MDYTTADVQMLQQTLDKWCAYLSNHDLSKLIALYESEAILLPTLADTIIQTQADRWAYFERLMQNPQLKVILNQSQFKVIDNVAVSSGFYTFSFEREGEIIEIPSRFTFIYRRIPTGWQIIDHHSSQVPQLG